MQGEAKLKPENLDPSIRPLNVTPVSDVFFSRACLYFELIVIYKASFLTRCCMLWVLSTRSLKRVLSGNRTTRSESPWCLCQSSIQYLIVLAYQAAKAVEAARKKKERGGAIGVPDTGIDDDDILALSAVSADLLLSKSISHAWPGNRRCKWPRLRRRCGTRCASCFEPLGE
jgi:hypothetical protein